MRLDEMNQRLPNLVRRYYGISLPDLKSKKRKNTRAEKNDKRNIRFSKRDFNPALISLINKVYSEDFRLFGYRKIKIENKIDLKIMKFL